MKFKIIVVLIAIFLLVDIVFAQDLSIKAEVDKTSLSSDENLTYKLIITSSEKKLPSPQIPKFAGFNVISKAQSSTISFAKSEIKTIVVYAFILAPSDIGKFKIEPSTIKVNDKTYSTQEFEIEVTKGKGKPQPKPEKKPALPKEIQPPTDKPQVTL